MMMVRVIGIALLGLSVAAQQPPQVQPQQPATTAQQPPNPDDQVSCRISREGNTVKRTCLTRAQWRKLAAQTSDVDMSGMRNSRCPQGAC